MLLLAYEEKAELCRTPPFELRKRVKGLHGKPSPGYHEFDGQVLLCFVDKLQTVQVADCPVVTQLVGAPFGPQQRSFHVASAEQQPTEYPKQHHEDGTVSHGPRVAGSGLLLSFYLTDGVESDQTGRLLYFFHDGVAGIDAGSAIDTFHLQAVTDVYTGGTNLHTQTAIDAIALMMSSRLFPVAARFAPAVIISNRHALIIHQHTLKAPVGAYGCTDELTHIGENGIKSERKQRY